MFRGASEWTMNNSRFASVIVAASSILCWLGLMTLSPSTTAFQLHDSASHASKTSRCCLSPWGTKFVMAPSRRQLLPPSITVTAPTSRSIQRTSTTTTPSTELNMVFDFFKKRSEEGIEQLSKLSDAASRGKLGKGLAEAASYTTSTNRAFADGLAKSRNKLLNNLESLLVNGIGVPSATGEDDDVLEELQDALLLADLGMATAEDIVREVRSLREDSTKPLSREDLMSIMRGKLIETLDVGGGGPRYDSATESDRNDKDDEDDGSLGGARISASSAAALRFASTEERANRIPTTLFVMGANGMGKTTTIGKLAHRLRVEGNQTVLLAACDTFRAGAVEQLQHWADRAGVDLYGPSDREKTPAAIVYGALDKAIHEGYDIVLVDTSGRLSNNYALTDELVKMKSVIQKRLSIAKNDDGQPLLNTNVPHETLLVLDAAQGRMALDSARVWDEEVGLTGLILTKLDGSARGGSVVAVSRDPNLPVKLIGVGEGIDDLRDFEPERFVNGLLGIGAAGGKSSSLSEGAALASRLDALRKERAERAPATVQKRQGPVAAIPVGGDRTGPGPGVPPSYKQNMGSKRKDRKKRGKR